jgi:hypothetical protein
MKWTLLMTLHDLQSYELHIFHTAEHVLAYISCCWVVKSWKLYGVNGWVTCPVSYSYHRSPTEGIVELILHVRHTLKIIASICSSSGASSIVVDSGNEKRLKLQLFVLKSWNMVSYSSLSSYITLTQYCEFWAVAFSRVWKCMKFLFF